MRTRRSLTELGIWLLLAVGGGVAIGWADAAATEVQGPVLLLMLLNFALTVAGRAPIVATAVASAAGLPIGYALRLHAVNPGMAIAVIPALIAAGGGALAGRFLDSASPQPKEGDVSATLPWQERPLSLRSVLGGSLVLLAAAGLRSVNAALIALGHPAAGFVSLVWQTMTLVGWIALAPLILRERSRDTSAHAFGGLSALAAGIHFMTILALCTVHATLITAATAILLIPMHAGWSDMARVAFTSYLPLDAAAYLAMVTLGYVSGVEHSVR